MNRLFRYLMLSMLALCTAGFVSCGDDDDDDDSSKNEEKKDTSLTGSQTTPSEISGNKWVVNWNRSKAYAEMNGKKGETSMSGYEVDGFFPTEIEFYGDGTMDCAIDTMKSKGSYTINGLDLSCTYDILLTVSSWDSEESTESHKRKSFTFKEGADLADCLYSEMGIGASDAPMSYQITKYQISKSADNLYITMVMEIKYNIDTDDFGDMGEWGNTFNNLINSKKEISYYIVYDKK